MTLWIICGSVMWVNCPPWTIPSLPATRVYFSFRCQSHLYKSVFLCIIKYTKMIFPSIWNITNSRLSHSTGFREQSQRYEGFCCNKKGRKTLGLVIGKNSRVLKTRNGQSTMSVWSSGWSSFSQTTCCSPRIVLSN